jgi:insertion element IS1 protein InsB
VVEMAINGSGIRDTARVLKINNRTWIKRLNRKTICFSKLELLHDTVISLLINKVEFGLDIHA